MSDAPAFFIPGIDPSSQEEAYAEPARFAQRSVPDHGERIYSITFPHDGEEWTGTVGEQLRGRTIADPRARAQSRRFSRPVSDEATVWGIFPGNPYVVVTDSRSNPAVRSAWENPFLAGRPESVTYFTDAPLTRG